MLSPSSFTVSEFTLVFNLFPVNLCEWHNMWGSNFILLHVSIQFSQRHVFKRLVFSPLSIVASLAKYNLIVCIWVISAFLISVPLVYLSVFMQVPYYC